jgi:glutathione S-transferase
MHALDEAGVEYVQVKEPLLRGRRTELKKLSGQDRLPVIEFEDGTALREESKDLIEKINAGTLGTTAAA